MSSFFELCGCNEPVGGLLPPARMPSSLESARALPAQPPRATSMIHNPPSFVSEDELNTITALYNAADFSKDRWRFLTPGAVATTLPIVATSVAFAWFANSLSSYNRLYGSLGTLLLLLVWLNVNCFFLILGFDLDAALNKARRGGERAEWMDEGSGEAA